MTAWYIDPNRLTSFVPNTVQEFIINKFGDSRLIGDLANSRQKVVDRFVENGSSMINEINSFDPALVVDLACGIHPYKNLINNIVGVDITAHDDLDYCCDFCNTPFKDNVADVILCLNGYMFKRRNQQIFSEIKRIAKNGARVYCRAGNRAVLKSINMSGPDYINRISKQYGFSFFHNLKNATFSDANDPGVYFSTTLPVALPVESNIRRRWVWTWVVNK